MSVETLLRRADVARSLVAQGELEPMAALVVVVFPPAKLLALEGAPGSPAEVFSCEVSSEGDLEGVRAVYAEPDLRHNHAVSEPTPGLCIRRNGASA